MSSSRFTIIAIMFMLIILTVPVLAVQSAGEEDHYKLKDEWKGKLIVKEEHGELTQVVFMHLTRIDENNAYELLGCKWFTVPVKYTINPSTPVKNYRLSQTAVVQAVKNSFETWDVESEQELYADTPKIDSKAKANLGRPDGKNVITWGRLSDNNVIAVTTLWYFTSNGQLIDTDMIFNTYYRWGIDADGEGSNYGLSASTFDIQNIGTHEAGHVCGLGDIYDQQYSGMTMYGYGSPGEVKKISLEIGDIAGLQAIY